MMGALAASAPSASQLISNLCYGAPTSTSGTDYCTWESGANKQGGLQAFLEEALSTLYVPDPHTSQTAIDVMEADAQTNCSTYAATGAGGSSGANIASKVSAVAKPATAVAAGVAAGVGVGAAAGSVIPVVGTIVGAIAGLIAGIFASGHAQAVKGEQAALCSAVPSVNAALQQIDSGLASGQITPAQAQSYYSQIGSQFTAALKSGTTYKTGDALWAYNLALTGILYQRNLLLSAGQLVGGGTIPSGAAAAIGAATGIPPLYLALGALAALYFVL